MINVQGLYKNYGASVVLNNISFSLGQGQKVALVGQNGIGKTTLLKILAGIDVQDGGVIDISENMCIGYLPQETNLFGTESIISYLKRITDIEAMENEMKKLINNLDDSEKANKYETIREKYEHVDGYKFLHKVKIILSGFGFNDIELNKSISDLSSGQKSKLILAGILLKGVDLLLLDEPTNNLDLPALIWLEDFLKKTNATCIIVSHDRKFLDRIVRKIFELDWRKHSLNISNGTYSDYLDAVTRKLLSNKEEYKRQQEEIARLNEQIRDKKASALRGSRWSGNDNDKFLKGFKQDSASKSAKTAKALEKRIDRLDKIDKPIERKPFNIGLQTKTDSGTFEICLSELVAGYINKFEVGPISIEIPYGERIAILGLNGTGKTTLLKTIAGEMLPLSGKVTIGSGLRIGNMMQEHENLQRSQKPLELLIEKAHIDKKDAHTILHRFGFNEEQRQLPISSISPGARARLLLAFFAVQSVNVLILDEPTNHLDIEAIEALEETLDNYRGTVVLVTHDRYFLEKSSIDYTYVLSNGKLSKISDYKAYIEIAEKKANKLLKLL